MHRFWVGFYMMFPMVLVTETVRNTKRPKHPKQTSETNLSVRNQQARAEIGGKTGSGRVRVGLTRFFFPFFSAINRNDIGSSKYTAIRDPARCREAHEAPYLHREHHDKLRGRWAGGSCNRDM